MVICGDARKHLNLDDSPDGRRGQGRHVTVADEKAGPKAPRSGVAGIPGGNGTALAITAGESCTVLAGVLGRFLTPGTRVSGKEVAWDTG